MGHDDCVVTFCKARLHFRLVFKHVQAHPAQEATVMAPAVAAQYSTAEHRPKAAQWPKIEAGALLRTASYSSNAPVLTPAGTASG